MMTERQSTMFEDLPTVQPHQVVRVGGTDASRQAAEQLAGSGELTGCFIRVLRWIWRWPDCTYRQLALHARELGERCSDQEPARRFKLLKDSGLIVESDRVRCPIGGTNCSIHRITEAGKKFLRERDGK